MRPSRTGALILAGALGFISAPWGRADEPAPELPVEVDIPSFGHPELVRTDALWQWTDSNLQRRLEKAMTHIGLDGPLDKEILAVALVDLRDLERPRVAQINGDVMFYAASLPKIAVMLAVYQKAEEGGLELDFQTEEQLRRMIKRSSNSDSTALMQRVGKSYIAGLLSSPRYGLYDPEHNGGLWVGKDYGKAGLWRRDPMHNLSHGATAMQTARFLYLLETGKLVSPKASRKMKELMADSAIHHKFVRGLQVTRPEAVVFRKSGTWRTYHADAAIVERPGGIKYIAVALANADAGKAWFPRIIIVMDRIFDGGIKPPATGQSASAEQGN